MVKHSTVNSKIYAALLSILIKEFEDRFRDYQNIIYFYLYICNSIFSVGINK